MMPTTTLGRVQIHARNLAVTQTVWMFEMTPTKATAHIYSGVRPHSAPRDSRTRESPQKDEPGGSSIAEGNANLEEGQYVSNTVYRECVVERCAGRRNGVASRELQQQQIYAQVVRPPSITIG